MKKTGLKLRVSKRRTAGLSHIKAADAALELGVSRQRVAELIRLGKLVTILHGKAVYVSVASIEARKKLSTQLKSIQAKLQKL
jgi:hypothetical protein